MAVFGTRLFYTSLCITAECEACNSDSAVHMQG